MSHADVAQRPEPRFSTPPEPAPRSGLAPLVGAGALMVLAAGLRLLQLDHTPHYDELFHVMGAQSWLHDGDLCIHNCTEPYGRAALFTYTVAGSLRIFGETLVAARLPSVLFGALWVAAVYLWTRHTGGRLAGWIAGLLLLVDPGAIYLSQLARFYVLHALAFWVGAACTWVALEPDRTMRSRGVWLAGAAAGFLVALHLQVTTMIGLLAVGLWAVLALGPAALERIRADRRWRLAAAAVVVLGLAALALAVQAGFVARAWRDYQWTNMWPNENDPDPRYLFFYFQTQYEWLWQLFPVAAVVALYRAPRPAVFLLVVFGVGFVLHSFAGFKAFRVVYYVMPFMLAIWGIALAAVIPALLRLLDGLAARIFGRASPGLRRTVAAAAVAVFAAFLLVGNTLLATTRLMLTRTDLEYPPQNLPYRGFAEWDPVLPELRAMSRDADVLVVTAVNKALWYLGRADVSINENQMFDGHGRFDRDFTPDYQAGVPLIRKPESLERILACYPDGVLIAEIAHWDRRGGVPEPVVDVIERYTTRVPLEGTPDLLVFRWDRPAPIAGADCTPLPLDPAALPRRSGERRGVRLEDS